MILKFKNSPDLNLEKWDHDQDLEQLDPDLDLEIVRSKSI